MFKTQSANTVSRERRAVEHSTRNEKTDDTTFAKISELDEQYSKLILKKRDLEIELSRIKDTLQRAKAMAFHSKNYMPPAAWKRNNDRIAEIKKAILDVERELQPIKAERKRLNIEAHSQMEAAREGFPEAFHMVAKQMLAGPVYDRLVTAALHRAAEEAERSRNK